MGITKCHLRTSLQMLRCGFMWPTPRMSVMSGVTSMNLGCFQMLTFRRCSTRSSLIESLQREFKGKVTITDTTAVKITVESSKFNSLSTLGSYMDVLDCLPDEWKSKVVIETKKVPETEIDRQVRKVYLKFAVREESNLFPPTPQSLLDDAVFHLAQGNDVLSTESIWNSANLSLENFAYSNGFECRNHEAKNLLIDALVRKFGPRILKCWVLVDRCYSNTYEEIMFFEQIRMSIKMCVQFNNLLFKYHNKKTFDIRRELPSYLDEEICTTDGELMTKRETLFKFIQ